MFDRETKLRFKRKVQVDSKSRCWFWVGARTHNGYGQFWANGQMIYAHRYLDQLVNGPIPSDLELHHLCRNRACVRPSHLLRLTHAENMRLAALEGAWAGEKNSQAKSTNEEASEIRAIYNSGASARAIAEMLDMPMRSVYYLLNEGWGHLPTN